MLATIDDVRLIEFPVFERTDGSLAVYEGNGVLPFDIRRCFVVKAGAGAVRGHHAHRLCRQLLVCLAGACAVTCDDGRNRRDIPLAGLGRGLLIPAGIWAEQTYLEQATTVLVLCDQAYSEADYLRDRAAFLDFRAGQELDR